MRQIGDGKVRLVLSLGALVLLGACNSGEHFGEECIAGDCPQMREIAGDLIDEVDVRSLSNERQEIVLPEQGERIIFAGTYSQQSESGNFRFEGRAGQWVVITVYSRGLVDPTFRLRGSAGHTRWSLTRGEEHGVARRVVMLPGYRTYELDVLSGYRSDESEANDTSWRGGASAAFVGTIETLMPPEPRPLEVDGPAVEERFLNVQRGLYELTGNLDGPVGVRMTSFHEDGYPVYALSMVSGDLMTEMPSVEIDETPIRYETVLYGLVDPAEQGPLFHVDTATHTDDHGWYRVEARTLSALAPDEELRAEVRGAAGQIVTAYHRTWTGGLADLEVRRDGEVWLPVDRVAGVGQQSTFRAPAELAAYLDAEASFEAVMTNPFNMPLYEADVGLEVKEPLAIWEVSPDAAPIELEYGEPMEARRSEFVVLDVQEPTAVSIGIDGVPVQGPQSAYDMDFYLFEVAAPDEAILSANNEGSELEEIVLEEGRYLLHAHPYSPQAAGFRLTGEFSAPEGR